jgi:mannose-1-phosphate guanylyltransferase / phosphomannomutase
VISIVILVGGKGTRVKSITNGKSKAEIKLNKKKIIDHQLSELIKLKKKIYLISNKNYLSLKQHVNKKYKNSKVSFIDENLQLGTAGALKNLETLKNDQAFLIVFGDLLFNFNFKKLIKFHKFKKSECTLVVHPNSHPMDSDCVDLNDNSQIAEFYKKPHNKNKIINNLCLSGILIVNKKLLKLIKPNVFQDISRDFLENVLKKQINVFGYKTREYIKDVGTPNRIKEAKKDLSSIKYKKGNINTKIPAVFLDRDGVINKEKNNGKYQNPKKFIKGSLESFKRINNAGFLAILITNQPAVAKGFITLKKLKSDLKFLNYKISRYHGYLDDIYYCIHHPAKGFKNEVKKLKKNCKNRKPNNGMFLLSNKANNIDFKKSVMIGDSYDDYLAAKKTKIKFIGVGGLKIPGTIVKKNFQAAINFLFPK